MPADLRTPQAFFAGVSPDINVTPLVDVCLVLLIIFMVVAPQLDNDVQVDLPSIFNADPEVEAASDPLEISVARNGSLWVDRSELSLDAARQLLDETKASEPSRRIVIRADQNLGFAKVRGLFTAARQAGYGGVAFMVNEKETGTPAAGAGTAEAGASDGGEADHGR